jgi:hypothetical protein
MERTGFSGQPTESPPDYVALETPDGVVLDKNLIERTAPGAMHAEDSLEDDDDFLSAGRKTARISGCSAKFQHGDRVRSARRISGIAIT